MPATQRMSRRISGPIPRMSNLFFNRPLTNITNQESLIITWRKLVRAILVLTFLLPALAAGALNIWVSPDGSDGNPGTSEKPMASIARALRAVREMRRLHNPAVDGGVHIIVRGGMYRLDEPLFVR